MNFEVPQFTASGCVCPVTSVTAQLADWHHKKKTMPNDASLRSKMIEALVSKSFATLGKDTSFSQDISYHFLHGLSVYQD